MRPSLVAHSKMEEEIAVDTSESFDTGVLGDTKEVGTSAVHRFPTLLGTMIHKLMEILVSTKNMARLDSAVGEILSEFLSEEALMIPLLSLGTPVRILHLSPYLLYTFQKSSKDPSIGFSI